MKTPIVYYSRDKTTKKVAGDITKMLKAMIIFGLIVCVVLFSGCSKQTAQTGILEGKVSIGPLCPVERNPPDPSCLPTEATYQAWPIGVWQGKTKVSKIVVKADGTFTIELPKGTYTVNLENNNRFGANLPAAIEIKSGKTTTLDIDIDTGIR